MPLHGAWQDWVIDRIHAVPEDTSSHVLQDLRRLGELGESGSCNPSDLAELVWRTRLAQTYIRDIARAHIGQRASAPYGLRELDPSFQVVNEKAEEAVREFSQEALDTICATIKDCILGNVESGGPPV